MAKRKKIAQPTGPAPLSFDLDHDGAMRVFCAALTGILANPSMIRNSPEFGVSFADAVVKEIHKRLEAQLKEKKS